MTGIIIFRLWDFSFEIKNFINKVLNRRITIKNGCIKLFYDVSFAHSFGRTNIMTQI